MVTDTIPQIVYDKLLSARIIGAFTGAGISAESNIPTFRGDEGIWTKFKPEELANFDAFMKNPGLVWEWYSARKKIIHEAQPNPGHDALSELEAIFEEVIIITQNIDNLHRRAGSTRVYELHGNIERNYCIKCGTFYNDDLLLAGGLPPKCGTCGGLVRPDVVWFGEFLPHDEFTASEDAAGRSDVFFSLGTSGIVYPAASIPLIAKSAGAFVIEINPETTPLTEIADVTILGKTGVILPEIVTTLRSTKKERTTD
jgi:NAD-dependent deacetylase